MVSTPSQRFCRRRFSFAACWLLSWFAMGMVMVRLPEARSMMSSGTVPPDVGRRMTLPRALSTALTTSMAMGRSIGVRSALLPSSASMRATLGWVRSSSWVGSAVVMK